MTRAVASRPPTMAVMVATPEFRAVTSPVLLTTAAAVLLLTQVTFRPRTSLPR